MDVYTALRMTDDLSSRMLDALHFWADNNPQGSTARTNNGNGGGTHGALVRRGLVGPGFDERGHVGYFLTPKAWAYLRHMNGTVRQADANRLDLDAALGEAYPVERAAAPAPVATSAETVERAAPPADESASVPGALVDPWTWIRRPSSTDAARAAEERAERRQHLADSRGANAHELAVAAVRQFVREQALGDELRVPVTEGSPEATLTRDDLHALAYSGHTTAAAVARVRAAVAAHIRHGEREVHLMFPALGMRPALYLPDVMALLNRWNLDLDAALTAAYPAEQAAPETPRTPVATQAPAEDLTDTVTCPTCHVPTGARCITRAGKPAREPHGRRFEALEEAAGITQHRATRRREAQARGYTSNGLDHKAEEALLTAYAARIRALIVPDSREPIVARASFRRADLDRLTTEAAVERATYRAEMDERQAADHRAHGVPVPAAVQARIDARAAEQLPARHVIGGGGVSHKGTVEGSTPADATHPNVLAARAALDGLAVATMTDHHDVTEPTGAERHVRGYMVDPREGARVAVYWLEGGRIVRRGTPDGAALDGLAERLTLRGWAVEKMFRSSQCVFAHRPSTD